MLLITPQEVISMAFVPRENISPISIRPLKIDIAQEQYILPRFGELMFAEMCDGAHLDFVENYIKPALCHYVKAALVEELSIEISENGAMLLDLEVIGLKSVNAQAESSSTVTASETQVVIVSELSSATTDDTLSSTQGVNYLGENTSITTSPNNTVIHDNYVESGTEAIIANELVSSTVDRMDDINTQAQEQNTGNATDISNENQNSATHRAATNVERKVIWSRTMSDANVLMAKAIRYVERNVELFPLYEKNNMSSRIFF